MPSPSTAAARSSAAISATSDLSPFAARRWRYSAPRPTPGRRAPVRARACRGRRGDRRRRSPTGPRTRAARRGSRRSRGAIRGTGCRGPLRCSPPSPARRCRRSRSRCTRASWSSTSCPGGRHARRGRARGPTAVSVVENGCGATTVSAPVSALNRLDLPLLGRPTSPRRSMPASGYRRPLGGSRVSTLRDRGRDVELAVAVQGVDADGAEVVQPEFSQLGSPPGRRCRTGSAACTRAAAAATNGVAIEVPLSKP